MHNCSIRIFVLVIVLISGSAMAADQLPDWFEPYPLSTLENETERNVPDYLLPLSQIARIQGLLRTQNEMRLSGELIRRTWQLATGNTPEQGFDHVRDQLLRAGASILYECSSRQCGASNLWANQVFAYANLLGVDSTQNYLAAEIATGHMAVYSVRRGNGRVYLHVDYIHSEEMAARSENDTHWQERLKNQGYVILPDWQLSRDDRVLELLQLMSDRPTWQLRLVLHQRVASGDTGLTESNAEAQQLEALFLDTGVDRDRISVYGVGALVPSVLGEHESVLTVIRLQD
ncbi:DUF4892 domain-containing protein [Nitrincola iocasae]|uniref:DUF4892 domain-containing protein n=1 Tax=Nitrincola iocasae TaxID=2614693 RepID=A0A5J6LF52_9GAMM|nr:DUF4892 domain-containing protein [Nitrincola iocasae]QEW07013.1 DUF4892 domain-containing protein [Nitrincola iocasae]